MSRIRVLISMGLAVLVVGGVLLSSASALALEAPETGKAEPITATTATLHGVLNPGAEGEPGGYQFYYAPSETECTGFAVAPVPPKLALGKEKEAESVVVTDLEPSKKYTFCIYASNLSMESMFGAPKTFETLAEKPAVDHESAYSATSTGASLEAQINTNNQETTYSFEYSTSKTLAGATTVPGGGPLSAAFGDQFAGVATGVLTPNTTYYFRVVAKNVLNEETEGAIESFTTVATPHTEAVTEVTATTATFHGTLTPLNSTVDTEYFFVYGVGSECNSAGTALASAGTGSGSIAVSAPATELQPSASYSVCLVSWNAFGFEIDPTSPQVHFDTPAAPPKIDGESASGVTPYEATVEAQVNPNNQETTYSFQYGTSPALTGATTVKGTSPLSGFGDQTASVALGHVLTPGTTYHYRVIAENVAHEKVEGGIEEFTAPALMPPIVEGESATGITSKDAKLEAQINPNYQAATYTFEYSTSKAAVEAGNGIPVAGGSIPIGSETKTTGPVDLHNALAPETTYFYRVVATNNPGGTKDGPVEAFTTQIAPVATTAAAQSVTRTTATFSGTVNPKGGENTAYHYAYTDQEGYEEALKQSAANAYVYGRTTPEVPVAPETTAQATEPLEVGELTPGTVYHYAVVATNDIGGTVNTVVGPDKVFTTSPPILPTATLGEVTGITQNAATINGSVDGMGEPTRWELQLGTTKGNLQFQTAGHTTSATAEPLVLSLETLAPGTVYYYKLTAVAPDNLVNPVTKQVEPIETPEGEFTPPPHHPRPRSSRRP